MCLIQRFKKTFVLTKSRNGTPPLPLFLTVRGAALSATPPVTFRTLLLRLNISVHFALDIPFAHRGARSAPGASAPQVRRVCLSRRLR